MVCIELIWKDLFIINFNIHFNLMDDDGKENGMDGQTAGWMDVWINRLING